MAIAAILLTASKNPFKSIHTRPLLRHLGTSIDPSDSILNFLSLSAERQSLKLTQQCHAQVHGSGLSQHPLIAQKLIFWYSHFRGAAESQLIFDSILHKSTYHCNELLNGYAKNQLFWESFKLFRKMLEGTSLPLVDEFTFTIIVKTVEEFGDPLHGKMVHGCGMKNGFLLDTVVGNSLMNMYGKYGKDADSLKLFEEMLCRNADAHLGYCLIDMYSKSARVVGRRMFDRLKYKNVFAWTAMINGYVNCGSFDEALCLFREMQEKDQLEPDKASLVSVLRACSSFVGLMGGRQIHGFAIRREFHREVSLCNALIDMYFKCGSPENATVVFHHDCIRKDAISWRLMICGYGLHGTGKEATVLFKDMLQNRTQPDTITLLGVLCACCWSGMINEVLQWYDYVVDKYDIQPTSEICACVVDMLGRFGQLDRAMDFVKSMPIELVPSIWDALAIASDLYENFEIRDLAFNSLMQRALEDSVSSSYDISKRQEAAAQVRKAMQERGLRKQAGCSWITLGTTTHIFFAGDLSHRCSYRITEVLDPLNRKLLAVAELFPGDTD